MEKSISCFKMCFLSVSHIQDDAFYSIQINFKVSRSSGVENSWSLLLPPEACHKQYRMCRILVVVCSSLFPWWNNVDGRLVRVSGEAEVYCTLRLSNTAVHRWSTGRGSSLHGVLFPNRVGNFILLSTSSPSESWYHLHSLDSILKAGMCLNIDVD